MLLVARSYTAVRSYTTMSRAYERGRAMRRARPRPRMVELRPLAGSTAAQSRPAAPRRRTVPTQHSSSPAARRCRFLAASSCRHVDCTRPGSSKSAGRPCNRQQASRACGWAQCPSPRDGHARPSSRLSRAHIRAVLENGCAQRTRFSIVRTQTVGGRHDGTRADVHRGSEVCQTACY